MLFCPIGILLHWGEAWHLLSVVWNLKRVNNPELWHLGNKSEIVPTVHCESLPLQVPWVGHSVLVPVEMTLPVQENYHAKSSPSRKTIDKTKSGLWRELLDWELLLSSLVTISCCFTACAPSLADLQTRECSNCHIFSQGQPHSWYSSLDLVFYRSKQTGLGRTQRSLNGLDKVSKVSLGITIITISAPLWI